MCSFVHMSSVCFDSTTQRGLWLDKWSSTNGDLKIATRYRRNFVVWRLCSRRRAVYEYCWKISIMWIRLVEYYVASPECSRVKRGRRIWRYVNDQNCSCHWNDVVMFWPWTRPYLTFLPLSFFNRCRIRWCIWTLVWRWFGIRSFPRNSKPIHVQPGQRKCYIRRSHGHKGVDWRRTWRFRVGRFPRASLFITFRTFNLGFSLFNVLPASCFCFSGSGLSAYHL